MARYEGIDHLEQVANEDFQRLLQAEQAERARNVEQAGAHDRPPQSYMAAYQDGTTQAQKLVKSFTELHPLSAGRFAIQQGLGTLGDAGVTALGALAYSHFPGNLRGFSAGGVFGGLLGLYFITSNSFIINSRWREAGKNLAKTNIIQRYDGVVNAFYNSLLKPARDLTSDLPARIQEMTEHGDIEGIANLEAQLTRYQKLLGDLAGKKAGKLLDHITTTLQSMGEHQTNAMITGHEGAQHEEGQTFQPIKRSMMRTFLSSGRDQVRLARTAGYTLGSSAVEGFAANNILSFVPGAGQVSWGVMSSLMLLKNTAIGIPAYVRGIRQGQESGKAAMEDIIRTSVELTVADINSALEQISQLKGSATAALGERVLASAA